MSNNPVKTTLYRWAGAWGPFKVKISCGECTLTKNAIEDTLENELADVPVEFEIKDWLSVWWGPLLKGGWHAPIVMVEGKIISQGHALNRGVLTQAVVDAYGGGHGPMYDYGPWSWFRLKCSVDTLVRTYTGKVPVLHGRNDDHSPIMHLLLLTTG